VQVGNLLLQPGDAPIGVDALDLPLDGGDLALPLLLGDAELRFGLGEPSGQLAARDLRLRCLTAPHAGQRPSALR
jgi:hypothetical protein